jgi:hypothetical protein
VSDNLNKLYGPSYTKFIPTTDDHRAALSTPNAEIVYVVEEHFEQGLVTLLICWRPHQAPSKPNQKKVEQPTYLTPVEHRFPKKGS